METIENEAAEARFQDQTELAQAQVPPIARGQVQLSAQRQEAMEAHGHADRQRGKQVQQQERPVAGRETVEQASKQEEQEQQRQSGIHHDWSKIQTAIESLSDKTLNDCVKRLNSSLFNKLYQSANVDERKLKHMHEISMQTFDKIMSEIDDEVKTQRIEEENENKKTDNAQYVGKERRQFISKPVMCLFNICFKLK